NKVLSFVDPFTKKEASLIRCASPPESVEELWPSVTYPSPTSCKGFNFFLIFSCSFLEKNSTASSMVLSKISLMDFWWNFTSNTSFLNRFPPQVSQVRCTSAINCISMVTSPSPLHVSQRPPSTLKEK